MSRFSLFIHGEDEPFVVQQNITMGRHLDNDLVLAGEDVHEYHARLELTARGPLLSVLGSAVVLVNDRAIEEASGLAPGDRVTIGRHTLKLQDGSPPGTVEGWGLKNLETERLIELEASMLVGRGENCELYIPETHISRQHARLHADSHSVWLTDLRSSNGTFVNGDRVTGSWEIYHGDEIFFDRSGYQLIAQAPDITPVITHSGRYSSPPSGLKSATPPLAVAATGTAAPALAAEAEQAQRSSVLQGPCLEGLNQSSRGVVVAIQIGQYIVGRAPESDIYLPESSVSLRHAEIDVRLDGCYLISLISTNGTWVNSEEIQTCRLQDGDKIAFGRVQFLFRDPSRSGALSTQTLTRQWSHLLRDRGAIILFSILLTGLLLAVVFLSLL